MGSSTSTNPTSVAATLRITERSRLRRILVRLGWLTLLMGGAAGVFWYATRRNEVPQTVYRTAPVVRGDLAVTVTATGTLNARDPVTVGSEISGRIEEVLVDINDRVKKDQILARIDPEQYRARRDESDAQALASKAAYRTAEATLLEMEQKVNRLRPMSAEGLATQAELEVAEAGLLRARAALESSQAQVKSSAASLKVVTSNLEKTIIRSPIDGVVLDRKVEPGEAVTSGLQTPELFVLAADLVKMELVVKIDEADVGQVKAGQAAQFTVDAYPNRIFQSTVSRVKNLPTTTQNVVTYETELMVENDQQLLRPGMTATATITVDGTKNALLVPNAALRYTPKEKSAETKPSSSSGGFSVKTMMPRPPGMGKKSGGAGSARAATGVRQSATIYVMKNGAPEAVAVQAEATDGIKTAVVAETLQAGAVVVLSEESPSDG